MEIHQHRAPFASSYLLNGNIMAEIKIHNEYSLHQPARTSNRDDKAEIKSRFAVVSAQIS